MDWGEVKKRLDAGLVERLDHGIVLKKVPVSKDAFMYQMLVNGIQVQKNKTWTIVRDRAKRMISFYKNNRN